MDYAILVVNGEINDISFYNSIIDKAKIVVACDGGANIFYKYGKDLDYIIGDLDSISENSLKYYSQKNVNIQKHPAKKDKTDSQLAIDFIKNLGINEIIMIGANGNRIDHFLANINLLYYAREIRVNLKLVDEHNEVFLLNNRENFVQTEIGQTISFLSIIGEVQGITLKGLEYELENYDLELGSSILTSNIALHQEVFVGIKNGSLVCVKVNE